MATHIRMKYHRFRLRAVMEVLIAEPRRGQFVWLTFYLYPRLRNGALSLELIKYVLSRLNGVHHIHPIRAVTTFRRAARLLGWRSEGSSPYFEECHAYRARSKNYRVPAALLLDHLIEYRKLSRLSKARTFHSGEEVRIAVDNIRDDFRAIQPRSATRFQRYTADCAARRR